MSDHIRSQPDLSSTKAISSNWFTQKLADIKLVRSFMMRKMSLGDEEIKVEGKREHEMDESSSSFGDSQLFDRQLSFSFHRSQLVSLAESGSLSLSTGVDDRIPVLPCDIVGHQIGSFVNDPTTLYSMACVSRAWRQSLRNNLLSSPVIWHRLYLYRWMRSLSVEASNRTSQSPATAEEPPEKDWKRLYRQWHSRDKAVVRLVREVASTELNQVQVAALQVPRQRGFLSDLPSVVIRHARWKRLMGNHNSATRRRFWMMDVLCAMANQETDYLSMLGVRPSTATTITPWERFLAASAVFQFHCLETTSHLSHTLERAAMLSLSFPLSVAPTLLTLSSLYEETAIILAHAMRPIPDFLQRSATLSKLRTTVQQQLATMTQRVLQFMQYYCQTSSRLTRRAHQGCSCQDPRVILYTIHYVMTKQYRLSCQSSAQMPSMPLLVPGNSSSSTHHHHHHAMRSPQVACSILNVLTTAAASLQDPVYAPVPPELGSAAVPCHPVLFAIIFQGIARRMGIQSDIVTCCSRNCRALLRVPIPSLLATPPQTPPGSPQRHSHQLYSSSPKPPPLRPNWFVDLQQGPGHILTSVTQCQEWLEHHCQGQSPISSLQSDSPPRNIPIVPDDDDSDDGRQPLLRLRQGSTATRMGSSSLWSQPPMQVSTMLSWLTTPFFRPDDHNDDEEEDALPPPEPHQILLQHLMQRTNNDADVDEADDLLALLQDRLLLFPTMLNYCQVIDDPAQA